MRPAALSNPSSEAAQMSQLFPIKPSPRNLISLVAGCSTRSPDGTDARLRNPPSSNHLICQLPQESQASQKRHYSGALSPRATSQDKQRGFRIPVGLPPIRNFLRSPPDSVVVSGLPILVIPGTMTAGTINVAKL